jgi:hypothetical protein
MTCPRERYPYGLSIQYSNSPEHPSWLVMWWGQWPPLAGCETISEATAWVERELQMGSDSTGQEPEKWR